MPKNTSFHDGFEVSRQLTPDAQTGNGEGAFTKFESGWLLDKVVVAGPTRQRCSSCQQVL